LKVISFVILIGCGTPGASQLYSYKCNNQKITTSVYDGKIQYLRIDGKDFETGYKPGGFNESAKTLINIVEIPHFECENLGFRIVYLGYNFVTEAETTIAAYFVENEGKSVIIQDFSNGPHDVININEE